MYKVTCIHHRKAYVKGDLEAENVIQSVDTFRTKKEVVLFLTGRAKLNENRGFTVRLSTAVRGKMPELIIYTNTTWIHENTGEEHQESYWYKTEKC